MAGLPYPSYANKPTKLKGVARKQEETVKRKKMSSNRTEERDPAKASEADVPEVLGTG
jgi:hypothetical protein